MTQDDRMETITDPAEIRATDEPDERGDFPCCADRAHKESLGGDSESGTYNRSNQPPAESRPDADNPWALLPDDHPKRPKQCGGCGTKWVDAETARACERRHGDDITTPTPVGAAVALDLDAIEARANGATPGWWQEIDDLDGGWQVHSGKGEEITGSGLPIADAEFIAHAREDVPALVAEVRRLTVEAATQREWFEAADAAADRRLDQSIAWMERAEAAEAEVVTLRDTLARRTDSHTQLVRENETLRAKVAAVEAVERGLSEGWVMLATVSDRAEFVRTFRAALAVTTGEGE